MATRSRQTVKRTRDEKLTGAEYHAAVDGPGWVAIPFAEGWIAWQRLAARDGRLVVSELRVLPAESGRLPAGEWSHQAVVVPSGGISPALIRRVPAGVYAVAPVVKDWINWTLTELPPQHRAHTHARRLASELALTSEDVEQKPATKRGRPGRKPSDRAFYKSIAADYRRWSGKAPARRIADKYNVSRATARTWISTARHKLGLLPETSPGRASMFIDTTLPTPRNQRTSERSKTR